jgi:UDP-N-acetylglucosamine 1-carboxyvinyltransferase
VAKFVITGGAKLEGEVTVAGSKNAVLALMPAALLADSPVTLNNVPIIRDVRVMSEIIEGLGGKVNGLGTNTLVIDPAGLSSYELNSELNSKLRASVLLAAPLLARFGKAVITPPGGDQIGERLLETHFSMLEKFGVEIKEKDGQYHLSWQKKIAPNVFLEEVSVTATEMAIILASSLEGETQIYDAACEPHVRDLSNFLVKMGAKIEGIGTNKLVINGKKKMDGCEHEVISDHIDGGTFAIAAAITGGQVELKNCVKEDYQLLLSYLGDMGVKSEWKDEKTLVIKSSNLVAKKRKFQTRPWPGFPTDLMSPFIVLATQTEGTVLCHDWMYEWRVFFVDDLMGMGANIIIADPHRVIITGPTKLHADKLICKDIRAGISVILSALAAEGTSEVDHIETVERGYENIEERFTSLGANIRRVDSNEETA